MCIVQKNIWNITKLLSIIQTYTLAHMLIQYFQKVAIFFYSALHSKYRYPSVIIKAIDIFNNIGYRKHSTCTYREPDIFKFGNIRRIPGS